LLFGGLIGLLLWYWQKSTSAEDGALDVLERLGEARRRIRELEAELARTVAAAAPAEIATRSNLSGTTVGAADNLEQINGIGPTYARRLREAGIRSFADLANQEPARLREVTGLRDWQAADPADWITEARQLGGLL
jgi:predicted flap endonuclease-1-like 5' DNA nuclease